MMLGSTSLMRRYTPPTCTLEILSKNSPLSRWSKETLIKDLRFELHFDDPRLPEEKQVTITGDRAELELLCEVVADYVQNFLGQTHNLTQVKSSKSDIFLQPKGLVTHELCLGSLAKQSTESSIILSASQLFDLANALYQFSTELKLLPQQHHSSIKKSAIVWATTAAAALVAVVLSTETVKVFSYSSLSSEVASSNSDSPVIKPSKVIALSPVESTPENQPIPSPTIPPELSSKEPLTPPQRVEPFQEDTNSDRTPVKTLTSSKPEKEITQTSDNIKEDEKPILPALPPLLSRKANTTPTVVATDAPSPNQTAELRNYFQQRWQPIKDVNQALEYRLVVQSNGVIKEIIPLGVAARTYISSMPTVGQKLVSPNPKQSQSIFRVVLSPDGSVKTFLE